MLRVLSCGSFCTGMCGARGTERRDGATGQLLLNLSRDMFDNGLESLTREPFQRPRMLELMIETCVCNGEPIRRNQDRWARSVVCPPHLSVYAYLCWSDSLEVVLSASVRPLHVCSLFVVPLGVCAAYA